MTDLKEIHMQKPLHMHILQKTFKQYVSKLDSAKDLLLNGIILPSINFN